MKWHLMITLALLTLGRPVEAEIEIAAGSGGGWSLAAGSVTDPEARLSLAGDLLFPLGAEWSLFFDASGKLRYGLDDGLFDGYAGAGADASYRTEGLYARVGSGLSAAPGVFKAAADALLSWDAFTFCASLLPRASVEWGDDPRTDMGLSIESTVSLSDESILRPGLTGYVFWRDPTLPEYAVKAAVGFSWYPGPVAFSLDAGYVRQISDLTGTVTVGTATLSIPRFDSFHEVSAAASITTALGRTSSLTVTVPGELRLMDHGTVVSGILAQEAEWTLATAPEIVFSWEVADSWTIRISAGARIVASNSAYLQKTVVSIGGDVAFRVDERKLFPAK